MTVPPVSSSPPITEVGLLFATVLLFFATVWYSWATYRMAGLMRSEYELKITPHAGLSDVSVGLKDECLIVSVLVTNTGVGFLRIEGLRASIHRNDEPSDLRLLKATASLPIQLAPGQSQPFEIALESGETLQLLRGHMVIPSHLLAGTVTCDIVGLSNSHRRVDAPLPQGVW